MRSLSLSAFISIEQDVSLGVCGSFNNGLSPPSSTNIDGSAFPNREVWIRNSSSSIERTKCGSRSLLEMKGFGCRNGESDLGKGKWSSLS